MISPHTPSGTRVMCINTRDTFYVNPNERRYGSLDGLTEGRVYVVRSFWPDREILGGFAVSVYEIVRGAKYSIGDEQGFAPQRFRVLEPEQHSTELSYRSSVDASDLVLEHA